VTLQPEPVQRFDEVHFDGLSEVSAISDGDVIASSEHTTVERSESLTFTEVVDRVQMMELEGSELATEALTDGDATLPNADIEATMVTGDALQAPSQAESRTDSFEPVVDIHDSGDYSAAVQAVDEPTEASADPSDAPPMLVAERKTAAASTLPPPPIEVRDHAGGATTEHRPPQLSAGPLRGATPAQLNAASQPAAKSLAFAPRQLVLLLLATAAVAIVSSMLVLSIERRFSPPASVTTPNDR